MERWKVIFGNPIMDMLFRDEMKKIGYEEVQSHQYGGAGAALFFARSAVNTETVLHDVLVATIYDDGQTWFAYYDKKGHFHSTLYGLYGMPKDVRNVINKFQKTESAEIKRRMGSAFR